MVIRPAHPDEAEYLSDLAIRSKAHWGYDDNFLADCRAVLTVTPADIERHHVTVADVDGSVAGFYAIEGLPPIGELSLLFVEPSHIGTGVGRRLFEHAVASAHDAGFDGFTIDADPYAEDFYRAMGAIRTGVTPSSVRPGRELPRLTFTVPSA